MADRRAAGGTTTGGINGASGSSDRQAGRRSSGTRPWPIKRSTDGRRTARLGGRTWRIAAASAVAIGSILTLASLPAGASTQSHDRVSGHVALTDAVKPVTMTAGAIQDNQGQGGGDQQCNGQDNGKGGGVGLADDQGQNGNGEGNEDQDCSGTIKQLPPESGTTPAGTPFTSQLRTRCVDEQDQAEIQNQTNDCCWWWLAGWQNQASDQDCLQGTVTFVTTTANPAFTVSSTGAISAPGTLAVGTYTVSGTDSDTFGDTGSWSFTLTVTASSSPPPSGPPPSSPTPTTTSASSAPTLTGITPGSGSTKGGITVTLTGTNLCNASAVDFGSVAGTGVSVSSACTTLTVTDPAGTGTVSVTVTTPNGTSNGEPFTYTTPTPVIRAAGSPTITGIAPTSGSPSGGETLTLVGTNLCDTTGVLFGTNHGTSVSVNSSCTTLTVVDPAGTGTVPVTVETAAGNVVAPIEFTYIGSGYWMASSNGSVYSFGGAKFYGSLPSIGVTPSSPIVAMADTPDHQGYWLFAADGGVFAFGNAKFYGSVPGVLGPEGRTLNKPIVAAEAMPNGQGYRLFASDGGVFDFGDAAFVGSLPCSAPGSPGGLCIVPNKPIESAASDPLGQGYWLVGGDGGVYALGDTPFFGSLGAQSISSTIVSMASTPNGAGYWVYGANGSVSPYGNAASYGSMLGRPLAASVAYGAATTNGHGYWLFGRNGGVFAFGSAPFLGSLQSVGATSSTPIVTGVGF